MITAYPTRIVIDGYEEGSVPKLEKGLSVWDRVTFSYSYSSYLLDDETKELIIPGGFNQYYLEKLFPRDKFINKRNEISPFNKVNFSINSSFRDNIQREAIHFLLNEKNNQKFLCLPTGAGKTYCSINYVYRTKKLPMVFVDQENLMDQWKNSILKFTDVKEDEVFFISGKESINKLLEMEKEELKKFKWFIAVHRTISNFINSDMTGINKLIKYLGIGVKLYDEAHVEFKNILLIDSLTDTESVYITATPSRSDPIENSLYQKVFKDVPMFKLYEDEFERYHNIIIVQYDSKPSIDDKASMINRHGFDVNGWCKYILEDSKFNDFYEKVNTVINKLDKNNDNKIALLFHTMSGNSIIQENLKEDFPDKKIGRFDSSIKDKNKRIKEWEKDIIVTTDKSFGKAIDVKDLSIVLDTVPFGSKVMTEQMLGRLRQLPNKEVFYVAFIDVGFDSCKKQLKQRRNIYNIKAKNIYEIDLTE